MTTISHTMPRLAAAALLCTAGLAHADITASTSLASFLAATGGGNTDNFADLTINTGLGTNTLSRAAGSFGYTASTQTEFFVVPVASAIALSTGTYSDTISFAGFTGSVRALGANFYGTNVLGEVAGGALTVVATDINGLVMTQSLTGGSASGFLGFISDAPLASVVLSMTTSNTNVWATVDNVVLSAVPEAGTWLMALLGGAAVLRIVRRRG
jgi:hypothetical protein